MMTSLGIYPRSHTKKSRLDWLHSISPYLLIIDLTFCNILSTTYVYQGSTHLSFVFEAFSLVIGGSEALSAYLNMRWKMNKVGDVHMKLQKIADQGKILNLNLEEKKLPFIFVKHFFRSFFSNGTKRCGIYLLECRRKMSSIQQKNDRIFAISTNFIRICIFDIDLLHSDWKLRYINILFTAACCRTIQYWKGVQMVSVLWTTVDIWICIHFKCDFGHIVFCVRLLLFDGTLWTFRFFNWVSWWRRRWWWMWWKSQNRNLQKITESSETSQQCHWSS